MVEIFGCAVKENNAAKVIHAALKRLEYKGYDSVGEATIHENRLFIKKDQGKIDAVHALYNLDDLPGRVSLGHIRWATHGAPSKVNAHPHTDCNDQIAVVHNGIIENFLELRNELEDRGHVFRSKTDSEVIPHLIEERLKEGLNFKEAMREVIKRLEGLYAIAAISVKDPNKIFCARNESSLVVGVAENAVYCASEVSAFLPLTNKSVIVENGELVILSEGELEIRKIADWSLVPRKPAIINWTPEMAEKNGYPHFMLKEIYDQPLSLRKTLRLQEKYLELMTAFLDRAKEVFLVACGTSYHACLAASYMFSKLAFLATHPVFASEFIEQQGKAINIESTILAVSQSGETADTLAAVEYARLHAATILGLTNVVGSTLTRVSRAYLCQQSGPEIGVADTKTFTAQLSVLAQLALRLAKKRGKISHTEIEKLEEKLEQIPDIVEIFLRTQEERIRQIARKYKEGKRFFFLGRGISLATALEGGLKFLGTNQIPSTVYPGGEIEYWLTDLIEKNSPMIFICPKDETHKKVVDDIAKMKANRASIIAVIEEGDEEAKALADDYIEIVKDIPEVLSPILCAIALQLFAYYMAVKRGLNPDMPRHSTNAVTVK
jgi:glucosamine--fructose-6-phosphate aminotransferase (isomerizing)